jgi:glutamyl-tRNA reductase
MAEQFRERELQRAQRALARGDDPRQILAQLSRAITNKLIHAPTAGLKQASVDGRHDLINSARKLLGLEGLAPPPVTDEELESADTELVLPTVETSRRTLQ